MQLVYIHTNKIDSRMANMVQVVAMCDAFAISGMDVVLLLPKSSAEQDSFTFLKSQFNISSEFRLDFYEQNRKFGKGIGALKGVNKILNKYTGSQFFLRDPIISSMLIRSGQKVITELHNNSFHSNNLINWAKKLVFKFYAKKNGMVAVITISESLKNAWVNMGIPKHKIHDLHDAFNPNAFSSLPNSLEARLQLGLIPNVKHAVYVGNISLDRGIDKIIFLAGRFPDIQFIVTGGPEKFIGHYLSQCQELGLTNVAFKGHLKHSEVINYLSAADILIGVWSKAIPTMDYCSPLKVFEYMAAGKLIVCEAFKPIKEVLKDGETAFLAAPDDKESLLEAMTKAVAYQGSEIQQAARSVVEKNYTWPRRVEKIRKLL